MLVVARALSSSSGLGNAHVYYAILCEYVLILTSAAFSSFIDDLGPRSVGINGGEEVPAVDYKRLHIHHLSGSAMKLAISIHL